MGDVRSPRAGEGPGHEVTLEEAIEALEGIGRAGLMTDGLANLLDLLRTVQHG